MSTRTRTQKLPPKSKPELDVELNADQKDAEVIIMDNSITVITGAAGTGKTLLACKVALDLLHTCKIDKIFIARPMVTDGEDLGYLPGELDNKMEPYMIPIYDNFYQLYKRDIVKKYIDNKEIEIAPVAYMMGRTFCNSLVILDEAQNMTTSQMKTACTRLGKGSKMIICGDIKQKNIRGNSGLNDMMNIYYRNSVNKLALVELVKQNRDDIVSELLNAFDSLGITNLTKYA